MNYLEKLALQLMASVKGVSKVIAELRKFGKDVDKMIDQETRSAAEGVVLTAKNLAPRDNGKLYQNISHYSEKPLQRTIAVNVPYAAYLEFGTGTKVSVPAEFQEIANEFKNVTNKGSFEKGLEAIEIWCSRKGIPKENAKWIFLNILKVGINPQPFLYPAWIKGKKDYLKNLEKLLSRMNKKI